jgi:lipoteichoic acid synthase
MIQSVFSPQELTQEQKAIIAKIVNNQEEKMTNITTNANNVIFIIVESYLSATSDLVVNGKEITPYLNQLKRDSTVFYNGKLKSNITIGESGDGQFICMTGILPLRSQITVGRAKEVVLPGLPKVLAQKLGLYTRMLIPTTPSMWEQERMCQQYGIQKLYSCKDYSLDNEDLNDQQIFSFIQELDKESPKPFFSLVLTMSMHQPYTETRDPSFQICSPNLSKEYIKYLNACHYTDKQIGQYLDFLKKNGLYEKSLIVITADHHPNQNSIKMNSISNELPLYIINANIDNVSTWKGECNQLDVYTTILDITVKTPLEWRGLGNTLFSPLYKNSLSQEKWDISEWILQGDYFSK